MNQPEASISSFGKIWLVSVAVLIAACLFLQVTPAQAEDSEADHYAQTVNSDLGYNYALKYVELVRAGWHPQKAYYAIWAYQNGWRLGYHHGWHDGAYQINRNRNQQWTGPWRAWMYNEYDAWLKAQQSWGWSKDVWGAFEKGYHDGYDKGIRVGWNRGQHLDRAYIPQPDLSDFGRAARNARSGLDPNDPWADLPLRPQVTGPGSF